MFVLHGSWVPPSSMRPGRFLIWAEDTVKAAKYRPHSKAAAVGDRPGSHPFQVDSEDLYTIIDALTEEASIRLHDEDCFPTEVLAFLPSDKFMPRPSLEPDRPGTAKGRETIGLAPWSLAGLALDADKALPLLATGRLAGKDWRGGDDWNYWQHAAWWVESLITRERFLPAISVKREGRNSFAYTFGWLAAVGQLEERQQLQELSASMPDVCRALVLEENAGKNYLPPAPEVLTADFVQQALDKTVRNTLRQKDDKPPVRKKRGISLSKSASPAHCWLDSLQTGSAEIIGDSDEMWDLYFSWQEWASRAPEVEAQTRYRTCFRLEPPGSSNDVMGSDKYWMLRFLLQDRADPSLLLPVESLAGETGVQKLFPYALHKLRTDLEQAANIFPPLAPILTSSLPGHFLITTGEAYQFLREAAEQLERSGFKVFLPSWWAEAPQPVALKLKINTPKPAYQSSGLLGMDALTDFNWEISLGGETVDPEEFRRLAELKTPLVQVRDRWVELDPKQIKKLLKFLQKSSNTGLTTGQALAYSMREDAGGIPVEDVEAEDWFAEALDKLKGKADFTLLPQPRAFQGALRPYQLRGFSWMAFLSRYGLGGCLADDMGLGKTIQFLALLLYLRQQGWTKGPALLVCPTSVLGNWQHESERFAPTLKVMVHHGPDRLKDGSFSTAAKQHDLVLTTYGLAHRDRSVLGRVHWDGIILDEAQKIKNHLAKQTKSIRALKAGYRLALTGTPLENRLGELWSIVDFLNPGYLGSYTHFNKRFVVPIERHGNQIQEQRLKRLVQPFILRRTKLDPNIISDLPEKQEIKQYCSLTREQASLYQAVVNDCLKAADDTAGIKRKGIILASLTRLKQICNHPAQFMRTREISLKRSGKLQRFTELLDEIRQQGEKALVFTQFTQMGKLLKTFLEERYGQEVLFLHGGIPARKRDEMVKRFQQGEDGTAPDIFLLSLKAGGTGLNLTAANHVFHFDRWWNPAVENQATDRAFRIGQQRNVLVHKFICQGTVEERIDMLLEEKQALADDIVGSSENWLTELSTEELQNLLHLEADAAGL